MSLPEPPTYRRANPPARRTDDASRILVIDDDAMLRRALGRQLDTDGVRAIVPDTLEEAREILYAGDDDPIDVILLDWEPWGPSVMYWPELPPVVVFSGADQGTIAAEIHAMIDTRDYEGPLPPLLSKPASVDEILAALRAAAKGGRDG